MAERTLLEIVQTACEEMAIPVPSSVVGSSNTQIKQLLALANREGKELADREGQNSGWPALRRLHTITWVADQANYAFPSDINYFINTTGWDRTQNWPLRGPVSATEWQVLKSGTIGSIGPRTRFRIFQDEIYFDPTPSDTNTIVLEYYTNQWCEDSVGTGQVLFAADDDVPRLPDDCFILGLKWRFRKEKKLDYSEEKKEYEDLVERKLGRSGMSPVVDLTGYNSETRFLDQDNIPDQFPDLV